MLGRMIMIVCLAAPALTGCAGWRSAMLDDRPAPDRAFVGFPDARDAGRLRAARHALESCRRDPDARSVRAYARAVDDVARLEASLRNRSLRFGEGRREATFAFAAARLPEADSNPCRVQPHQDYRREHLWRRARVTAALDAIPDPTELPPAAPRAGDVLRRLRRRA